MGAFDLFVILGAMRTGSNFLEESLNAAPGLTCHGEAFNPVFLAYPDRAELFGLTQSDRDADPLALLARLRDAPGLNGFRYFPDHDPRVLEPLLADPRCAKIVLGRNPLDSYLSLQIARETKQWRLKGADRKTARVRFDGADFLAYLEDHAAFHTHVARALQVTGQTAFPVSYDDLGDAAVLTGLLRFLGVGGEAAPTRRTVPQNPEPASEKVSNPAELARMVARLDAFRLGHLPSFEPDRGPGVRSFVTVAGARLIYMPIPGVEDRGLRAHLAGQGATESGLTQADLRVWMRDNPGFRSLTLIDHPLPRAWGAFARLMLDGDADPERRALVARLADMGGEDLAVETGRGAAFLRFLAFLRATLSGQTPLRPPPDWASQTSLLQARAAFLVPDRVLRRGEAPDEGASPPLPPEAQSDAAQALVRKAYARDFASFGFAVLP